VSTEGTTASGFIEYSTSVNGAIVPMIVTRWCSAGSVVVVLGRARKRFLRVCAIFEARDIWILVQDKPDRLFMLDYACGYKTIK